MQLFGFEFKKKKEIENQNESFVSKIDDDGSVVVQTTGFGGYGTSVDLDGTIRTEAELISKYRQMSQHAEVHQAIDEIVNEIVSIDEQEIVKIVLDDLDDIPGVTSKLKNKIEDEFKYIVDLLDFQNKAYEIIDRWYVDGRLYYHVVTDKDKNKLNEGIKELRYIDPRKIRKIKEVKNKRVDGSNTLDASVTLTNSEYYVYNNKGFTQGTKTISGTQTVTGLRIAAGSIVHITSGLTSPNGDMVLSWLHMAIKFLNELRSIEDAAVIYRLVRAPERRVWYIDVGDMPKPKAEQYVQEIMTKQKNRVVYDATTGQIRDDRKFMCYSLDTKIPLLDGRTLTLQELIKEYEDGKLNWVYSCNPQTGEFVPGPVSWAGITKRNSEVVRVTFDNGKSIICTPDHKFPVWEKGFVEAKDLVGESIIPGYRRMKKITSNGNEYEQIFKNDTKKWEFTHREVSKWKEKFNLNNSFIFYNYDENKTVIHHKNYNRFDNSPENITKMGYFDHLNFHRHQNIEYTKNILDNVKMCAVNLMSIKDTINFINNLDLIEWFELNKNKMTNKDINNISFTYKDLTRISILNGFKSWKQFRNYYDNRTRERNGQISRNKYGKKGSIELRYKLSELAKQRIPYSKSWKIIKPDNTIDIIENLNKYCRENNLNRNNIKYNHSKGYKAEKLRNHKAVSVEYLSEKIDVGCLTIDLQETYHSYHTYLLDAGVYTKNTMLEDFWLARKGNGSGTKVETLPPGTSFNQMDDVLYFQKRLFKSLGVPITRLDPENAFSIGQATQITRDELKFGKFIARLRNKFSTLFLKILERQLILKNILTYEEWLLIHKKIKFDFTHDDYFTEFKQAEVLTNRLNVLQSIENYIGVFFSKEWVKKNVLKQTDEEIEEIQEQMNDENDENVENETIEVPPLPNPENNNQENSKKLNNQNNKIQ